MIERWHAQFNPKHFLAGVNIDRLIEHSETHNKNKVDKLGKPCILCGSTHGPGLLLNDNSYLCKSCFNGVSTITYPEKYERLYRNYLRARESRRLARDAFIQNCFYRKISTLVGITSWISLILLFFGISFIAVPVTLCLIYLATSIKHKEKIAEWESTYPEPVEPQLRHFHDPKAELTPRDRLIIKIFNNWPGYPPFWRYLRKVVIERDGNRCQVSGCPSRVELHIHHKIPVSQGGEHVPTNLVTLCGFHHALEPDEGHERIWGEIKTRYFTMVRAHKRRNPKSPGYHNVRAHVRRLELVDKSELSDIIDFYGLSCPFCGSGNLTTTVNKQSQTITVTCLECSSHWKGPRKLAEETGPRLAEALTVTRNEGQWKPRWDMLETRADSTFRLLKNVKSKTNKKGKTM